MMRIAAAILLSLLLTPPAPGQDDGATDRRAMDEAWRRYTELLAQRDYEASLVYARRGYELAEALLLESDESLAIATFNYGNNLLRVREREESVAILKLALDRFERVYGRNGVDLIPALLSLGTAIAAPFDEDRSRHHFRRALKLTARHYGDDSVEYADVAFQTSRVRLEMAQSADGRRDLHQAHRIYVDRFGTDNPRTGRAAFYLGKLELARKRYGPATEHFLAALQAFDPAVESQRQMHLTSRAFLVQAYESKGESELATEHCLAIGRLSALVPKEELQPLFRSAPEYPMTALRSGRSGHADIEFTVDENGFVTNPRVIAVEGSRDFEAAALRAVQRFRYAPSFVDGEAVETDGVKTRITFRIEQ